MKIFIIMRIEEEWGQESETLYDVLSSRAKAKAYIKKIKKDNPWIGHQLKIIQRTVK